MNKLHKLCLTIIAIATGIVRFVRNYCDENPWVVSTCKTLMVVFSIIIAILSAVLWHISASWQEQLVHVQNLSAENVASITAGAAILNTKAALLSVVAALMNGIYFWLGTAKSSTKDC